MSFIPATGSVGFVWKLIHIIPLDCLPEVKGQTSISAQGKEEANVIVKQIDYGLEIFEN